MKCNVCKGWGIVGGYIRVGDGDVDNWEATCDHCHGTGHVEIPYPAGHLSHADAAEAEGMEIGTEKVQLGETVEVKVNTHDGRIFVKAKVIEVHGLVFTVEMPTGKVHSLSHSSDEWRKAA